MERKIPTLKNNLPEPLNILERAKKRALKWYQDVYDWSIIAKVMIFENNFKIYNTNVIGKICDNFLVNWQLQ